MARSKAQKSAARKLLKKPRGRWIPIDLSEGLHPEWLTRAFSNNRYVVMINDNAKMTGGITAIKAMIRRHDEKPIPNHWAEMQAIKNKIFGPEAVGIEFYPAVSNLVDVANIYWLWILPEDSLPLAILSNRSD